VPLKPTAAISSTDKMDDGIAAIMRGATDLKNTKTQLDEQVLLASSFLLFVIFLT
jgi:hypothetical protein